MALLNLLRRAFAGPDLAIDLGTANTRVYAYGHGLIVDRPTRTDIVAAGARPDLLMSSSRQQWRSEGEPCSYMPLRVDAIQNIISALPSVRSSDRGVRRFGLPRCRILACCPVSTTFDDRRMLIHQYQEAADSDITLVPGPFAGAIGMGLDVQSCYAQIVVDIGEGITEVAVIRAGAVISSKTSTKACAAFHNELQILARDRYGIRLSRRDAERLTQELGTAPGTNVENWSSEIRADLNTGNEASICLTSLQVNQAIHPPIIELGKVVNGFLLDLPDDIACEVIESGISLTGGGACLRGMADFLGALTRMQVRISHNPLHAVISGAAKMLENGWLESIRQPWMQHGAHLIGLHPES
jgi:rod shape-determining protein MreB and related proteins